MRISYKNIIAGTMIASTLLAGGSALAQDSTGGAMTSSAPTMARKTVDIACMGTAVAARETAIASAFSTKSAAISAALTKRASDLAAAWAITTAKDRNAAIKAAWKAFNASAMSARKAYRASNLATWKTFRTAAKVCKGSPSTDAAAQGTDNNL